MELLKTVREEIYDLHLIADKQPVTFEAHKQACESPATMCDYEGADLKTLRDNSVDTSKDGKSRLMPALLQVDDTIESEATEMYYGENTFALIFVLPRHLKLVHKVVLLRWTRHSGAKANNAFAKLSALPQLESLTVAVNEKRCFAVPHTTK